MIIINGYFITQDNAELAIILSQIIEKTQKEINKGYYNSRLINTSVAAKRNILYLSDQSRYLLSLESDKACLTRPVMKSN